MANLHPTAWVAPGAYLRGDVTLGEQTNVLGVVLNKCRYLGEEYGYS